MTNLTSTPAQRMATTGCADISLATVSRDVYQAVRLLGGAVVLFIYTDGRVLIVREGDNVSVEAAYAESPMALIGVYDHEATPIDVREDIRAAMLGSRPFQYFAPMQDEDD